MDNNNINDFNVSNNQQSYNNDLNNKNNSNTTVILAVIIAILVIVVAVLGTLYFTSGKSNTNNNNNNNSNNTNNPSNNNNNNNSNNDNNGNNNNNTPTIPNEPTEKTLTEEELNKYLSYVPMLIEYDTENEQSVKGGTQYGFNTDAYTGKSVTVSDLDKRLLLAMAYNMTEKNDVKVAGNYSWCRDGSSCTGDEYVSVEKLNSTLKKMYNMDNAGDTVGSRFRISGGVVEKSDQYYVRYNGMGGATINKGISKVKRYNVKGDTLTIYEQAGFKGWVMAQFKVLRYTNQENDGKYEFDYWSENATVDKYFEDNLDSFKVFKHTFKLGSNNEYYYYSTEEFK